MKSAARRLLAVIGVALVVMLGAVASAATASSADSRDGAVPVPVRPTFTQIEKLCYAGLRDFAASFGPSEGLVYALDRDGELPLQEGVDHPYADLRGGVGGSGDRIGVTAYIWVIPAPGYSVDFEGVRTEPVGVNVNNSGAYCPSQQFSDVPLSSPFHFEVDWMRDHPISQGYPDMTYRPVTGVSRQAMAAFMYRFAYEPTFTPPALPTFTDVPSTHPFYSEIEWMAAEGMSEGYTDGTFRPTTPVSRQAMSAFIYSLVDPRPYTPPAKASFTDVSADNTFYGPVEWMAAYRVSTGYQDGSFRPTAGVTRQAMAAFLYRAFNLRYDCQLGC